MSNTQTHSSDKKTPARLRRILLAASTIYFSVTPPASHATDYHVGDSQPLANIAAVPWQSLIPGDTVWIHWRAAPYHEKWVIGLQGTQAAPISVRGVPGPNGQLPVIDGQNATTPSPLNFWNEVRSVIKIGGSNVPDNSVAKWIIIDGLDVRGAHSPNTFTADDGSTQTYNANAAAIHIELGENITIRNCIIRDSGNGLFVSSSGTDVSRNITIESNYIHDNGNSGSIFEHNTYTAAIGITYQYNRFGPLLAGAGGNNLKDRSSGLVVRYNWIEGGNRQCDLVDAEDSTVIATDAAYHSTSVYGNILIEPAGAGNKQIIHYGGDSGDTTIYRKGTLYFYQNTLVSTRTDSTTLMRLSTNEEHCDARNNILYVTTAGNGLAMLDQDGVLDLHRNWAKPGWRTTFGTLGGTINDDGTMITGTSPSFTNEAAQDFTLQAVSQCIDTAVALNPAVLPAGAVTRQYIKHQSSEPRSVAGAASDIGAFERQPSLCPGDLNCDGHTDLNDIPAFVMALLNPAAYTATYPTCDITRADMNADSSTNARDIPAFTLALLSSPCP